MPRDRKDLVTLEQQENFNLRPVRTYPENFVTPYSRSEITQSERDVLGQVVNAAGEIMSHRQMTHHVRSDDTAVTHAAGSLLYSVAFVPVVAIVTGAFMMLATWAFDADGWPMFLLWLLLWGISCLLALIINRQQGLHFSSAGLGHHELESREHVAMYIVDRHIDLLEKKWGLK